MFSFASRWQGAKAQLGEHPRRPGGRFFERHPNENLKPNSEIQGAEASAFGSAFTSLAKGQDWTCEIMTGEYTLSGVQNSGSSLSGSLRGFTYYRLLWPVGQKLSCFVRFLCPAVCCKRAIFRYSVLQTEAMSNSARAEKAKAARVCVCSFQKLAAVMLSDLLTSTDSTPC